MPTPIAKRQQSYQPYNRIAAEIILKDPEKFGGEQALLVIWAKLWWATHMEPHQ